ncbi:hypothetical protein Q7P37_010626 [Cladosporium fusiforme]
MSSLPKPSDSKPQPENHIENVAQGLDKLTAHAGAEAPHNPSTSSRATSYFRSFFPYASIEDFEDAWHLGNYVIDRQTGKKSWEPMSIYVRLGMHFLYYGSEQEAALHWKRTQALLKQQSEKMGALYDSPASKDHIKPFIESFGLRDSLKDMAQPDPEKYATFNDFFAREINPSARPIAEPNDPLVISSPADCRLSVFPTTDQATKYWIKGYGFTLAKLLNSEPLASTFNSGSIAIARLAPQDYHRWHAPIDGTVESITDIPGTYYTVNPQAVTQPGTLDVFCENKRSVMLLRRKTTESLVAVVAVGAMLVGSIVYNPGIQKGAEVKRGQCLGAFRYGGSTVIVLFPPGETELDRDLVANSTQQSCETLVRVGWRMGGGPVAAK